MKADISCLTATVATSLKEIQSGFDEYQKGFFTDRKPEFFSLELCGEAGELANLEKKLWKGKIISHDRLNDEAADVFIALQNYCNARGIDLGKAVAQKLDRIEEMRFEQELRGEKY